MRWFFALLVLVGVGYWWQHHTPETAVAPPKTVAVASASPAPAPALAAATPVQAAGGQASWPRRNIDRAQAAVTAAKQSREGL